MHGFIIGLLVWLQVKHFIADYLLQTPWILSGKGHLDRGGGYVHAAIHVAGTAPALIYAGLDGSLVAILLAAEFAIHFLVDHLKVLLARARPRSPASAGFWAMHGADQLVHHLTYAAILYVVLRTTAA
jgi:hypothetical protein